MAEEAEDAAPAAEEEKDAAPAAEGEKAAAGEQDAAQNGETAEGEAAPKAAPKRRGRPRDEDAPKRPQAPKSQFAQELRLKLREEKPELAKDLKAMFEAINEKWEVFPQETKDEMQVEYDAKKKIFDKEMAAYRKTVGFRDFSKKLKGFLDIKAKKKMIKKHKKEAPLKPKNGYQSFCGEYRKEHEEKLKTMERADVAALLSKSWEELGEAKQEETYQVPARAAKKQWEADMVVFRRTEKFREQQKDFVALETKQNIRKIKEEAEDFMPRKPPNAILLWADKTDNRGALGVMSEKFKALSEEERKPYVEEADKLKAEFREGMAKFKLSKENTTMQRKMLMQQKREVVMTARKQLLVDMPKRPGKAHAVFAAEWTGNKLESKEAWEKLSEEEKQQWQEKRDKMLEQWEKDKAEFCEKEEYKKFQEALALSRAMGKSKGKGKAKAKVKSKQEILEARLKASMPAKPLKPLGVFIEEKKDTLAAGEKLSALKRKYDDLAAEEKKAYEEKQAEATKKFTEEYDNWKKTPEGMQYGRLEESKKRKFFETAARKKCLLADAVPDEIKLQATIKPNSTPQGYFLEEKKMELAKENPALGPRDLNKKALEMWEALDEEGKAAYKTKTDTSALKKSEAYHKYIDMHQGMQMRHKLKGLKAGIMDKLPKKPPTPMILWARATGNGGDLKKMAEGFAALPAEEREKYRAEQKELREKFMQEMDAFNKSKEGSSFLRNSMLLRKRSNLVAAKRKYLSEEPKRPPDARRLFIIEAKKKPPSEGEEGSPSERWSKLSEEERKKYIDLADEKKKEYEGKREEFEKSESYIKYQQVNKRLSAPKAKAKGKAKVKAKVKSKRPISAKAQAKKEREESGMPAKPPKAVTLFMKENKGGGNLAAQHKAWVALGAEGQKKYVDEAAELGKDYDEKYKEWEKSSAGKRYLAGENSKKKRAKVQAAKEKFLGAEDAPKEPVKPKNAMLLFLDEKKQEVEKENPSMGSREVSKEVAKLWSGLDGEGRKPYQDKAVELEEQYNKDLEEFKKSEAYIKYAKAAGIYKPPPKPSKPKSQPKAKGKGKAKGKSGGGAKAAAAKDSSSSSSSSSDSDEMGSDIDSD